MFSISGPTIDVLRLERKSCRLSLLFFSVSLSSRSSAFFPLPNPPPPPHSPLFAPFWIPCSFSTILRSSPLARFFNSLSLRFLSMIFFDFEQGGAERGWREGREREGFYSHALCVFRGPFVGCLSVCPLFFLLPSLSSRPFSLSSFSSSVFLLYAVRLHRVLFQQKEREREGENALK